MTESEAYRSVRNQDALEYIKKQSMLTQMVASETWKHLKSFLRILTHKNRALRGINMKTTDIGFERFEEEFYADPSTAFIKPKDAHPTLEQRKEFYKRNMPYVKDAWERYVKKMKTE